MPQKQRWSGLSDWRKQPVSKEDFSRIWRYKKGLKRTLRARFLKFSSELSEWHTENVKTLGSHPQVWTTGANPGESIYSRNIGGRESSQEIDWAILYNNALMRSFSDENESIINGWGEGEGCCSSSDNTQRLERRLRHGRGRLVTAAFWEKGRCKWEAKGARFSPQAVHFSHQCLLLFLASCQRHWCRLYPSSTAVIMLLATAWLKDLICKT